MRVSASEYISALKIEQSIKISGKDTTVLKARLDSGFLSPGTFSNFFNRFTGLSPKQYQKEKDRLYADLKKHEQEQEEGAINYPPFSQKEQKKIKICFLPLYTAGTIDIQEVNMFYVIGLGTGIVSFFVGCTWYTAVFGKVWQRLMGFTDEKVKSIFVLRRIIVAVISELIASLCTVGILYNLPAGFPLIVRAVMLMVVVAGSGVKLAIFDGKSAGIILIDEGYKIISILLFFISLTLFGQYIVF